MIFTHCAPTKITSVARLISLVSDQAPEAMIIEAKIIRTNAVIKFEGRSRELTIISKII